MFLLAPWCAFAATLVTAPSSEEILARVADTNARRHAVAYSGVREYRLRNAKFAKEATVVARMIHRPGEGKHFTVLKRSGSAELTGIVERLLASEADASMATKRGDHEISSANYRVRLRGIEIVADRVCYAMDLLPKRKSKFLIEGILWVDQASYGVVRLQGSPSGSVSMWVGKPQVTEEFTEIGGWWLPSHTHSVSSGRVLGTSELEIRYTEYQFNGLNMTGADLSSGIYQ